MWKVCCYEDTRDADADLDDPEGQPQAGPEKTKTAQTRKGLGPSSKITEGGVFDTNQTHLCRLCTEVTVEQGRVKLRAEVIITYHTHDEPMA